MEETIFNKKIDTGYQRPEKEMNYQSFKDVIETRRSARFYEDYQLPKHVIENALEDALLAPNSSNLQPWDFHWVRSPKMKKELARLCFNQNGARTASDLIVCIARTDTWKRNCQRTLDYFDSQEGETPEVLKQYYGKIAPSAYGLMGPLGIFSPFKWLLFNILGLFQVMAREPIWPSQLKTWAVKTTALACENIMLSIRAQGFDTLPMEGFDAKRVKKLLKLGRHHHIVMVISAGKVADNGIYSPRLRFPKEEFIHKH
jgi:nitroreductase